MADYLLTLVTPTFNRADYLPLCFSSLCAQTDYDFEWIIVDDGSTDNTEQLVKEFYTEKFRIKYVKKENGGKHTALNEAHRYVDGKYVMILDSDDTLTPDAISSIRKEWGKWEVVSEVGVIRFLKGTGEMLEPICTVKDFQVPVDIVTYGRICTFGDDCCEVVRTELFKKYPFPVFEGERFLAEGVLWGRVSFEYKCVYVNKVIYACEYLEGGLTKSGRKLRISNPLGGMCHANIYMAKKNDLKLRLKNGLLYTCYGFFAKKTVKNVIKESNSKAITLLCLPFGRALYHIWLNKYINR